MVGIYKITNPKGKIYIGKSKDIKKRWNSYHKLWHCSQQIKLYNSLKKYSPSNHIFEVLELCNPEELNFREILYIKKYNSVKKGLNLTHGGDGGEMSKESEELRRINSMKPILKYSLKGKFIKEYKGASDAILEIGRGNSNNINDCARGRYKSTYGYQWVYKEGEIKKNIPSYNPNKRGSSWTPERRRKTSNSRIGEKRSLEYKNKLSKLKMKPIHQYDIEGKIVNTYPSFKFFEGSKIIGTTKLRKILNQDLYYKGYRYSHIKDE